MPLEPHQKKILELHLELEHMMADLYGQFADAFKEHQDFWLSLASEEKQHAAWLNKLIEGIEANKVTFDEGKTRTYTLNTVLSYLQNIRDEFSRRPFGIARAISLVRDFENSLIDKNLFQHFDGDSTQAKKVIAQLEQAQKLHIQNIEQAAEVVLKGAAKNS